MTITQEQVADLQRGDVVTIRWTVHPDVVVTGPLRPRGGGQWVGPVPVIGPSGELSEGIDLTVVSRAPRPLYVNHPRTKPTTGDVVRDAKGDLRVVGMESPESPRLVWWGHGTRHYGGAGRWTYCGTESIQEMGLATLLVDGETGQVVPS